MSLVLHSEVFDQFLLNQVCIEAKGNDLNSEINLGKCLTCAAALVPCIFLSRTLVLTHIYGF